RRSLIPPGAMRLWEPWADEGTQAFHVLMAASGIASNVTDAMQRSYGGYLSGTHRIGAAVTIPYMRTTRGRNGDWAFDPAFDVARACGGGRLAHDALQAVLDHAARTELPVQFSLVGEAPSDAACDSGEWDLQAFLIQS